MSEHQNETVLKNNFDQGLFTKTNDNSSLAAHHEIFDRSNKDWSSLVVSHEKPEHSALPDLILFDSKASHAGNKEELVLAPEKLSPEQKRIGKLLESEKIWEKEYPAGHLHENPLAQKKDIDHGCEISLPKKSVDIDPGEEITLPKNPKSPKPI